MISRAIQWLEYSVINTDPSKVNFFTSRKQTALKRATPMKLPEVGGLMSEMAQLGCTLRSMRSKFELLESHSSLANSFHYWSLGLIFLPSGVSPFSLLSGSMKLP